MLLIWVHLMASVPLQENKENCPERNYNLQCFLQILSLTRHRYPQLLQLSTENYSVILPASNLGTTEKINLELGALTCLIVFVSAE